MPNYFGNPAGYQQQYGAAFGSAPSTSKPRMTRPNRFNFGAICLCLFLPWVLFCCMYAVMSFSMHYNNKVLAYGCVVFGLIFVVAIAKLALDSVHRRQNDPNHSDPSWFIFLTVACFLAWSSGVVLGDMNYSYNMEPYYNIFTMNSYPSVDPSKMAGQQVMDAGRLTFVPGSSLDLKKAMAFRNFDTYCVAPIVNGNNKATGAGPAPVYDFWAVGLNCCSGAPGSFSCGEYNNPHASSGLRVMRDQTSNFYRLAVEQAEATYNIRAKHPLFLYWMQDPIAEISAYADEGFKYYLMGVFTSFAFLLVLIIAAVVLFSKMS